MYIVCGNTDLRKGINSLTFLIADHYEMDVYDGSLFLFCGRRNDCFKGLYWDGEGFTMLYKRFENGRLQWPRNREEVSELTQQQVEWLLQGLNPLPEKRIKQAKRELFTDWQIARNKYVKNSLVNVFNKTVNKMLFEMLDYLNWYPYLTILPKKEDNP